MSEVGIHSRVGLWVPRLVVLALALFCGACGGEPGELRFGAMLAQTLVLLVFVCGLAVVTLRLAAKAGVGRGPRGAGKLEVLEEIGIGSRQSVVAIRAGERVLVVGRHAGGMETLGDLSMREWRAGGASPTAAQAYAGGPIGDGGDTFDDDDTSAGDTFEDMSELAAHDSSTDGDTNGDGGKRKFGDVLRGALGVLAALTTLGLPSIAHAQAATESVTSLSVGGSPLVMAVLLAALGLLPFLLVVTTSFAKIAVVLSILRSALGTQNVPPNMVLAALAVVLSAYVMAPVAQDTAALAEPLFALSSDEIRDVNAWGPRLSATAEPLRAFLELNAGERELGMFAELRGVDLDAAPAPLSVAMPAFAITELAEAFQIGFLLFLPFLVLDLLVGSVLLSLGMHMLSPTTVSMPFKLLLFVLINGWIVLSQSLVLGYAHVGR